jgi:hypothetical protein
MLTSKVPLDDEDEEEDLSWDMDHHASSNPHDSSLPQKEEEDNDDTCAVVEDPVTSSRPEEEPIALSRPVEEPIAFSRSVEVRLEESSIPPRDLPPSSPLIQVVDEGKVQIQVDLLRRIAELEAQVAALQAENLMLKKMHPQSQCRSRSEGYSSEGSSGEMVTLPDRHEGESDGIIVDDMQSESEQSQSKAPPVSLPIPSQAKVGVKTKNKAKQKPAAGGPLPPLAAPPTPAPSSLTPAPSSLAPDEDEDEVSWESSW